MCVFGGGCYRIYNEKQYRTKYSKYIMFRSLTHLCNNTMLFQYNMYTLYTIHSKLRNRFVENSVFAQYKYHIINRVHTIIDSPRLHNITI